MINYSEDQEKLYHLQVGRGEAVQQLLEQAQNLASSALELLGQYTAQKTPRKHSLLRKAAGAAILTGTALYLVPA